MPTITEESAFTRDFVDRYSREQREPDWMRQRRFEGLVVCDELPPPEGKLDWTKLRLAALAPSRFVALRHQVGADFSPPFAVPDLTKRGVIFSDFATALRQHPQLVEKHFMAGVVPARSGKFAALHAAFWTHGTFLYVPAGVELKMPLRTEFRAAGKNAAHFAHTLIVVERHAKLTYLDHYKSSTEEGQGLFDGVTEIVLGEGASLVYAAEQQWGRHVWDVSARRAVLARDANLTWLNLGLGGAASKMRLEAVLDGAGASVELLGVTVAQPGQTICYDTLQDHRVPYTKSNLLFKAAVKERAHTAYEGTIRVHKAAQKTDAYQASRNLLLKEDARADATPILEIEANDVRCTHGATVGPVDPEQLLYLRSRGLSVDSATRLMMRGFFDQAMRYIPDEILRDELWQAVDQATANG